MKSKPIKRTNKLNGNIIFLDIDGVFTSFRMERTVETMRVWSKFDPVVIDFMNRMWWKYDIAFVICSTWRQFYDTKELKLMFSIAGFQGEILSSTYHKGSLYHKPSSVIAFVEDHKPKNWLVVDDEPNSYTQHDLRFNDNTIVSSDPHNGMLFEHMEKFETIISRWK